MKPHELLAVSSVINAAGPVTRYGGSFLSPRVLEAMSQATRDYVRLDELQIAAGRKLAEWTGAEAGYVTTGAAAGLTMGAAALMAGLEVDWMEQLPDTTGIPHEFILQDCHRGDYDHAIRSSGARLVSVTCDDVWGVDDVRDSIESATGPKACATAYVFRTADRGAPLQTWVQASHDLGLRVLVDASVRLPPIENLKQIPGTGADVVAFSGGKAVQGPQGSGFVVGKKDLIDSILLQNQDMDVNAETWYLREWLKEGRLSRPPHNGIGRGYKVSKETIVGLLVALEEYMERDHEADQRAWNEIIDLIVEGLSEIDACKIEKTFDPASSYPVPMGVFRLTRSAKMSLVEFVNRCASLNKPLLFEEGTLEKGYLIIHPMCLSEKDAHLLLENIRQVLTSGSL